MHYSAGIVPVPYRYCDTKYGCLIVLRIEHIRIFIVYCAYETPYRGSGTSVGIDALKPNILFDLGIGLFVM
jgi:hypothetical protein